MVVMVVIVLVVVFVCVFVSVCVFGGCAREHVVSPRLTLGLFFDCSSRLVFETGSLITLKLISWARLAGQ